MSKTITDSTKISILDSKIVFDQNTGLIYVDLTPSVWIGSGASSVLGAKVKILTPTGSILKDYGSGYDVVSPMTSIFSVAYPKSLGRYMTGTFRIFVKLYDGTNVYELEKTRLVCDIKTESISGYIKADCSAGKALASVYATPAYQGLLAESNVYALKYYYPSESEVAPETMTIPTFEITSYAGENKLLGSVVGTYNFGENVFVKIKYSVSIVKKIRCSFNLCGAFKCLEALYIQRDSCSGAQQAEANEKINQATFLITIITVGQQATCDEDVSDYIEQLEQLLGCDCGCEIGEGFNRTPIESFQINGCNVGYSKNGLTNSWTIDNYGYEILLNGGNTSYFSITTPSLTSCVKYQTMNFNLTELAKALISLFKDDAIIKALYWQIDNERWNEIDPLCLTTSQTWLGLDDKGKKQLIIEKICEALNGGTGGGVGTNKPTLQLNCGAATFSSNFVSGQPSSGIVTIPVIVTGYNGTISGTITGINFTGTLQTTSVTLATTSLSFLLNYDGGGVASQRNLTVNIAGSANTVACVIAAQVTTLSGCSAPLQLAVVHGISGNVISFAPASFAPASYQVLRRYFGSADAPGSYTTIGTPVYNSGTGLFEIVDTTSPADDNVYIYKAISLCADGSRPYAMVYFANQTCPAVSYDIDNDSIGFSFTNVGGDTNRYEVSLWNISQTVQYGSTQVFTTVFPSPITGSFTGLTLNTQYVVKVASRILVTPVDFVKTCSNTVQTTTVMSGGTAEIFECISTGRILDIKSDGVSLAPLSGVMPIVSGSTRSYSIPSGTHTISGVVDGDWYALRVIGSDGTKQVQYNLGGAGIFSFVGVVVNNTTPWKIEMDCVNEGNGEVNVESCANVYAFTGVNIEGDVTTETVERGDPTFDFNFDYGVYSGTVSVSTTGTPGSISVTDTDGNTQCIDFVSSPTVFTGVVFEGTAGPLIINVKCDVCNP